MQRSIFAGLAAAAAMLAAAPAAAQEQATVSGRVTNAQGQPEQQVNVRIAALGVGTSTAADGSYRIVVPGARLRDRATVEITAARIGLTSATRTIVLTHGANLTQNFQLVPASEP